jgi:hypothetical protein
MEPRSARECIVERTMGGRTGPERRTHRRPGRVFTLCTLALVVSTVCVGSIRAESPVHPLDGFAAASLDRATDRRDSLARGFNPAQLPLLVASVAEDSSIGHVRRETLYAAFSRWHFWAGARWDADGDGLWSVDAATVPVGDGHQGTVLAAHASLELVQLTALARLATAVDQPYDALVWWTDHARLRDRLQRRLLDGHTGTYADLDSLGARRRRPGISSTVALAAGLPVAPATARATQWRLWTGTVPGTADDVGGTERMNALERAEALHGWSADPGLRLLDPRIVAALIRTGVDRLADVPLSRTVDEALGAAGLRAEPVLRLRLGAHEPTVGTGALVPRPLERARAAVHALDRMGVLSRARSETLPARVDSVVTAGDAAARDRLVADLTALLATWRAQDPGEHALLWSERRDGRPPLSRAGSTFRWSDVDAGLWQGRALDLLTEDVVAHHLRARPRSPWRGRIEPAVVGRGDPVRLRIETTRPVDGAADTLAARILWTDGRRVLPALAASLVRDDEGWSADLGTAPDENGLWQAVVEGLPAALRLPPAVSVVDPLHLDVYAVRRQGRTLTYRAEVTSQVAEPVTARLQVEAPVSFEVTPAVQHDMVVDPGAEQVWEVQLRPDPNDGPALHPVRIDLFDARDVVASVRTRASVPFQWLRLGPLEPRGDTPVDHEYAPDLSIDLARRFDGVLRTVGWNRLPGSRVGADGWIRLADADDPEAVHYVFTAFTTGSRESVLRLESNAAATARVNGRLVARTAAWGGDDEVEVRFDAGTNFVLLKIHAPGRRPARVRLEIRDIDGRPLRGVSNALESLLDQYAYLTRTQDTDDGDTRTLDRESMRLVPFTFDAPGAGSVSVVGSFNGWSPTATRMVRREDGRWQAKVRLQPGRFEYKFAVDGSRWIADPSNPEAVDDGFGGRNSVLVVE